MQLRIIRTTSLGLNGIRHFGYFGIGLYESVVPGMPAYQSLSGQLTDMPQMPQTLSGYAYHWPTAANAALASLSKKLYTNTSPANKASMDSLENALNNTLQQQVDAAQYQRSVAFGKDVAAAIYTWSTSDGYDNTTPYTPPIGPGLWAPTFPNFPAAAGPYWGNNRRFVQTSLVNTDPPPPPPYSANPTSEYYARMKEVYDVSQSLTPADIALALYYRDNPGYASGTHYISIFKQVQDQEQPSLDEMAIAEVLAGIALVDANIGCFRTKYQYNAERPIRYIRTELNHPTWTSVFNAPGHPDYPSGHSTNGGAFEEVMTELYGDHYTLVNHTYDYMGFAPRTYNSFAEMAQESGRSRVLAGIHTTAACVEGRTQGKKIARNVINTVQLKKGNSTE